MMKLCARRRASTRDYGSLLGPVCALTVPRVEAFAYFYPSGKHDAARRSLGSVAPPPVGVASSIFFDSRLPSHSVFLCTSFHKGFFWPPPTFSSPFSFHHHKTVVLFFIYNAQSSSPIVLLTLLFCFSHFALPTSLDNVSRRHYPLRDGLQPRHSRTRSRLRIRTVRFLRKKAISLGLRLPRSPTRRCKRAIRHPSSSSSVSRLSSFSSSSSSSSPSSSSFLLAVVLLVIHLSRRDRPLSPRFPPSSSHPFVR